MTPRTLGIIGGIAPESTIAYYRQIIAAFRRRDADGQYPHVVINSIDLKRMLDSLNAGDFNRIAVWIAAEVQRLADAGADLAIIASNTSHAVFEEVRARSPIPMISIVEATRAEVEARGLRRVALFGTRFTMVGDFYRRAFGGDGVELVIPSEDDREVIHSKYMTELVEARFLPETRRLLLGIVDRMRERDGIDGVILAGTELPLLLPEETHGDVRLVDSGIAHTDAAVAALIAAEE